MLWAKFFPSSLKQIDGDHWGGEEDQNWVLWPWLCRGDLASFQQCGIRLPSPLLVVVLST